jgi:hypothetical protein
MGTGKTHPDESSFIKTCRSSTTVARVLGNGPAHLKMFMLLTILSHLPRLFFEPISGRRNFLQQFEIVED